MNKVTVQDITAEIVKIAGGAIKQALENFHQYYETEVLTPITDDELENPNAYQKCEGHDHFCVEREHVVVIGRVEPHSQPDVDLVRSLEATMHRAIWHADVPAEVYIMDTEELRERIGDNSFVNATEGDVDDKNSLFQAMKAVTGKEMPEFKGQFISVQVDDKAIKAIANLYNKTQGNTPDADNAPGTGMYL